MLTILTMSSKEALAYLLIAKIQHNRRIPYSQCRVRPEYLRPGWGGTPGRRK